MASRFSEVELLPPVDVFGLVKSFLDDTSDNKVGLWMGAYRTEEGDPWVLPVVREAERVLAADETLDKEYIPILGLDAFCTAATKMILGDNFPAIIEGRAFGVQTLSGTGALRVGAEFLARCLGYRTFYYSKPTWENHRRIFIHAGFTNGNVYRYWDANKCRLDIDGLLEDLTNAPENSVIILHACAHNPTGCDPTEEQWKQIANVIKEKKLFPFFDSAFQGFASGDLVKDAWSVRYFASQGFELFCAQSFAKNFGLYNERVGNLTFVLNNASCVSQVKSQVALIIRGLYSNPPSHGARIIAYILNNPHLYEQWKANIRTMSSRINETRKAFRAALEEVGAPGNWEHLTTQIGMVSYTNFSARQLKHLVEKHHIYMLPRISICGITPGNVRYLAEAICETLTNVK